MIGLNEKREYPWDILEIDETDDKKRIKKAYAVLIKQYKPDESPEKFKEIQAAYKYALLLIFRSNEDSVNINENVSSRITGGKENKLNSGEEAIVEQMLKNLKKMTFSQSKNKDELKNWKFIEKYYDIDSLELKDKLSKVIFKNVAENNLFLMSGYNRLLVNPKILVYMNEVFDWTTKWQDYALSFPEEYFIVTLDYIENKKGLGYFVLVEDFLDEIAINIDNTSQKLLNLIEVPIKRFWALIIDLIVALIFLIMFDSYDLVSNNFGNFYLFIFIVIRIFIEILTKKHLSIGKFLLRLKIISEISHVVTINIFLIRQSILYLSFGLVFGLFSENKIIYNTSLIIITIVFTINILTLFIYNKLFHDYLTKYRVVNI